MADSEEWFVGEDGCLSVGKPTDSVTYHSTLNTILVATKEPAVKVLDVTSGLVLQSLDLSGKHNPRCVSSHFPSLCSSLAARLVVGSVLGLDLMRCFYRVIPTVFDIPEAQQIRYDYMYNVDV